jgi:hypothetical protein
MRAIVGRASEQIDGPSDACMLGFIRRKVGRAVDLAQKEARPLSD